MNRPTNKPIMTCVYRGRDCVGFLLIRGRYGFEAFDNDEHSIGFFTDEHAAAAAILNRAPVGAP